MVKSDAAKALVVPVTPPAPVPTVPPYPCAEARLAARSMNVAAKQASADLGR